MNNLISHISQNSSARLHISHFFFALSITFILVVSIANLNTHPPIWVDEAKSIELASSFRTHRTLDIQTSDGVFSGVKPLLQSTGYALTIPLAWVFTILGESFTIARIFMLFWIVLLLEIESFGVLKKK